MSRTTRHLSLCLLLIGPLGAGCDDAPPATSPESAPPPAAAPPPAGPKPPAEAPAAAQAKTTLELEEKDFTESLTNRDPFRSFLAEFSRPARRVSKQQRKVILPRYGLDELKLIAVVTGGTRPRAMFTDPTGLGVAVKRGDYISKSAGKVKQILSDKVVVEIEEQSEEKSSVVDRVIDLHPKEKEEKDSESEEGQ